MHCNDAQSDWLKKAKKIPHIEKIVVKKQINKKMNILLLQKYIAYSRMHNMPVVSVSIIVVWDCNIHLRLDKKQKRQWKTPKLPSYYLQKHWRVKIFLSQKICSHICLSTQDKIFICIQRNV